MCVGMCRYVRESVFRLNKVCISMLGEHEFSI